MDGIFVAMLPLVIGSAVVPIWIIVVILLLLGDNGLVKAAAFVAGATLVRLLQGVLFGWVLGASTTASGEEESGLIVATLLMVLGLLLLITAYRYWRKEDDPDAPPPKWMSSLSGLSPLKAGGMGALLMLLAAKQWVFTLSAISLIQQAQMGTLASTLFFLLYMLAAQSLVLAAVLVYALRPETSAMQLARAQVWLERNNRVITMAISLIFGLFFLWKGVSDILV